MDKTKDILKFWLILYCYTDNRFIIKSEMKNCIKLDNVPVIKNKAKISCYKDKVICKGYLRLGYDKAANARLRYFSPLLKYIKHKLIQTTSYS